MTLQVKILDCHRLLLIRAAEFFYMQGTWPSPNMRHSFMSRQSQAADTPYQSYFLYSGIVCIYEITDPICVTWSIPICYLSWINLKFCTPYVHTPVLVHSYKKFTWTMMTTLRTPNEADDYKSSVTMSELKLSIYIIL
jgi:hypothetical protein